MEITSGVYKPRDPRTTALYEVVRDNLETLYGAIDDGAIAVRIPKHARKELEARGFCPSCTGRRMNATAANLIERVLPPQSGLWPVGVDVPVPERAAREGALGAKTGAVTVVQRTSSDLRLHQQS